MNETRREVGKARRYFWGNTLRQALSLAARYHAIAPEELDYRPVDKRHGFVKQPRRVLIEVDPARPRRQGPAAGAAAVERALPPVAPVPPMPAIPPAPAATPRAAAAPGRERSSSPETRERGPEPRGPRPGGHEGRGERSRPSGAAPFEPPSPPDAESALAAEEAIQRLLRLSGLTLDATVTRFEDHLAVTIDGADAPRLRALGLEFLDDLGHLLPRVIKGLCGRQVACRVDGAGLRGVRELELQEMAREAARKVLLSGEPEILAPLPAAERRIVHVFLADEPRLATESLGHGLEKPMRIALSGPGRPS